MNVFHALRFGNTIYKHITYSLLIQIPIIDHIEFTLLSSLFIISEYINT